MSTRDAAKAAVLVGATASVTPAETRMAATGLTDLHFLLDARDATPAMRAVCQSLAPTTVVDVADPAAGLRAVRDAGADVVATFADPLCAFAAVLNRLLAGEPADGVLWGRKDVQRATLVAAGVSAVRSARVETAEAVRGFVHAAGYPVVVKPVDGASSRDTWILRSDGDTEVLLATAAADPRYLEQMFAERFIDGVPPRVPQLADYVSAEVFRATPANAAATDPRAGSATVEAFVTDRLAPAAPFRETGLLLPSGQPIGVQTAALDVAARALDALRVEPGAFHVEIKPRDPAPEIVEVNGRLGGYIGRLARYGANADLARLALACVLGRPYELELRWRRCVTSLMFQAPAGAARITAAPTRREVVRALGVVAVDSVAGPGPAPNWRGGTNDAVAKLWLAGTDHDELFGRLADVAQLLAERFQFTDAHGDTVQDHEWLEAVCKR